MNLIEELKRLDSEATKAPWHFGKAKWLFPQFVDENSDVAEQWVCSYDGKPPLEGTRADAEFKSFLRNNLPRIIALLEAGEALYKAVQHDSECGIHTPIMGYCDCENGKALAAYKAAAKE